MPGPNIAFFGGISASVLHLLCVVVFALGGIGFVGVLGLLIAGIGVPGLIVRLIPGWLAWLGLVLAAVSEVSFLGLLWSGFEVLLPIGRFAGLLWLAAVGFMLPRNRHAVPARPRD